jgi:DNA-directed RNA polymerase specialized sigma subunit
METEYQQALSDALKSLDPRDHLLLRMRFEEDLTLAEIARLAGLKDAQTADRKIRAIVDHVRGQLRGFFPRITGKAKAASV